MRLLENQNLLLKKYTKKPFFKFIIAGVLNTAFTYLIYLVLLMIVEYKIAYTISFIIGILFSFAMNQKYVFNTSHNNKKLFYYPIIYIIQYFISIFFLVFLIVILKFPKELAPFIIIIILVPFTYFLNKIFFTKF